MLLLCPNRSRYILVDAQLLIRYNVSLDCGSILGLINWYQLIEQVLFMLPSSHVITHYALRQSVKHLKHVLNLTLMPIHGDQQKIRLLTTTHLQGTIVPLGNLEKVIDESRVARGVRFFPFVSRSTWSTYSPCISPVSSKSARTKGGPRSKVLCFH